MSVLSAGTITSLNASMRVDGLDDAKEQVVQVVEPHVEVDVQGAQGRGRTHGLGEAVLLQLRGRGDLDSVDGQEQHVARIAGSHRRPRPSPSSVKPALVD